MILDAHAGADGRAQRHDGGGAGVDQAARDDQIVIGVGQDDEAFLHELLGGSQEFRGVREKRLLVADHFQLDPVRKADFAAEARGANGFFGVVTAGGIRQQEILVAVDVIEQGFLGAVGEVDAAHGDGDHVRRRRLRGRAPFRRSCDICRCRRSGASGRRGRQ